MDIGKIVENVLTVGGIAGLIALIITGAICGRYYTHGPEDIPQILTYSLTTIIGFYFGAGVTGKIKANGQDSGVAATASHD